MDEEMDEKMDVECSCEHEMDSCPSTKLTTEEKLERYKKRLEEDLKRKLESIEYDKERDKIREEFEKAHAEELDKIKKRDESRRICYVGDDVAESEPAIPIEEINKLKARYKELESRQAEILETATDTEKLTNTPTDQMNAMVDEYISAEKLKLILVDRIRGALTNRRINLNCDKFSKYNLSFKKGTDND